MDYELCKQLKDAGFPQGGLPFFCDRCKKDQYSDEGIDQCDCCMKIYNKEIDGEIKENEVSALLPTETRIPNLSELIEACSFDLRSISWHSDGRVMAKSGAGAKHPRRIYTAKDPETAVAKLWLSNNGI